jgi:hypothetical protein
MRVPASPISVNPMRAMMSIPVPSMSSPFSEPRDPASVSEQIAASPTLPDCPLHSMNLPREHIFRESLLKFHPSVVSFPQRYPHRPK